MDLQLFCEWLIHLAENEKDYSAKLTLDGISHFCHIAGQKALSDHDLEEWQKYKTINDFIYHQRRFVSASNRV